MRKAFPIRMFTRVLYGYFLAILTSVKKEEEKVRGKSEVKR